MASIKEWELRIMREKGVGGGGAYREAGECFIGKIEGSGFIIGGYVQ